MTIIIINLPDIYVEQKPEYARTEQIMLAQSIAGMLEKRGIHYGWVVVLVTFMTSLSIAGTVGLGGVFIGPITKEFGWSTADLSAVFAIRLLLFGLMAPFAAAFMERYGVRSVIVVALALVIGGMTLGVYAKTLWQFVLLWGFVVGFGTGLTAMVLGATVASRWFDQRRGLVLGLLTAAVATGQLAFLPLAAWLVEHYGWRIALAPTMISLAIAAVLVLLLMKDRPFDVGQRPFGAPQPAPGEHLTPPPAFHGHVGVAIMRAFSILREGLASLPFWVLFGTFFICGLSTAGLVQTHFISLCNDFGMSQVDAASTLAMMGAFDFVGTILSGYLSDRYNNRSLLFWYYGLRGLSLLWLPQSTFTFYGLSLFAVFYGLDWVATVPPTVRLAGQYFGAEKAPLMFGWIFAGHQIGSAVAAWGGGLSRTLLQSYLPAFYIAGALCLVAAASIFLLRDGGKDKAPARPAPA